MSYPSGGELDSRICQVIDEDGGAFAQGQDGIPLDLGVGRQDPLGETSDDALGQVEILES
jgi:hypothetical protein